MEHKKEASMSCNYSNQSPSPSNQSNYSFSNTNEKKMTICIGKNQQQYNLNDLQLLSYFEALFSSRWKYDDTETDKEQSNNSIIIGDNKSLQFGIDELSSLVHIKKYNRIPIAYNYKKIDLLCNAIDFFSEDILNEELLIKYFKKCKPSLTFKVLTELTKYNNNNNKVNKLISSSAVKYLQNIQNNIVTMKQKWLDKYKLLPISHVSYDNDMIASIFVRSYSIQWVQMQNETKRKWLIQTGKLKSFFNVWDIIKKRQLYKYNRIIFDCIEKMCNDIDISVPIHHNVDESVLIVLKKIFIQTMQIVVMFNNEKVNKYHLYQRKRSKDYSISSMDDNKEICVDNNHNNDGNDSVDHKSDYEFYDYHKFNLQELIRTHMEFIIVNRKKYFEIDELKQMLSIAHYMNGIQKYAFLKTLLSFNNDWIENVGNMNIKQNRGEYIICWKNLMKYLISSDVDYSINCVSQWLSIFIDESKFILNTVSNQLNTDGSHKLGFAIANYVTSDKITEKKSFDPQYMQFLYNSLGLFWKLNNAVGLSEITDLDDQHVQLTDDEHNETLTIGMNDNKLFNV